MTLRRVRPVRAARAVAAVAGVFALALAPAAALAERPPVVAEGAAVALDAPGAELHAGDLVSFTGSGFVRAGGGGQVVNVKFDDVPIVGTFTADASGAVRGTVAVPASAAPGAHWLRFLAGAGRANDAPARSLVADFTLVAQPAAGEPGASQPAITFGAPALASATAEFDSSGHLKLTLRCAGTVPCRGAVHVASEQAIARGNGFVRPVLVDAAVRLPAGSTRVVRPRISPGVAGRLERFRALRVSVTVRGDVTSAASRSVTLRRVASTLTRRD